MLLLALAVLAAGGISHGTATTFETVMDVAVAKNPASTELVRRIVQATFEGHETRYITDMRSVIRTLLDKCFVGKFLIIEEGSHYRVTNVHEDVIKRRSQVHWTFRKTYPWWRFWVGSYKVEIYGQFCDRERFRNRQQCDAEIAKAGSLIEALGVCAARKIPILTLDFAADVTDAMILDFLFNNNSPRITRQAVGLRRSLSKNFFEMIVESCRRTERASLKFGLADLSTDSTDARYDRYMVDRNKSIVMYRFGKDDQTSLPFTVLVAKSQRFSLSVIQGAANDRCSSLDAALKVDIYRL